MNREENVIKYYVLCNKLKDIVRTGWKYWNVQRERVESVAEHIYWVQMLAIAMKSEYKYDIDISKVIMMIAIHELWETIIWDLTQFEISKENKKEMEHGAVHNILKNLIDGENIENLFLEFDERKTKEALFAYQCDKLECDLQCKLYDESNCVDLNNQDNNTISKNEVVQNLLMENQSWSDAWIKFGQSNYSYDENFMAISNYALNYKISN